MSYILEILPQLFDGLKLTVLVFVLTLVLSIPLGMLLAFLLRLPIVKWFVNIYVWIMRGTPLLVQLIIIFYALPMVGLTLPRFLAALVAFVLNYAAYYAEIFRGGINAIPKGQLEAAKVLKLTKWQTVRYVQIPQVMKIVLPSVFNEIITLVKDSSLIYVVGLGDLLRAGKIAMSRDVSLIPIMMAAMIYLILIGILTILSKKIEQQFDYYK
ncbi:amino acid ABC transporter permease [Pseudolactococcus plantarum]|uniref:Amino acid ABC transporter permease n=1 Tax=Pseudolactococcus plantarum TaxID=1365 RepID=A0A2A5S3A9_9LACT|nr:amino acid ABC transporter permease [Lactococcus plantarum]MDN6070347.1 amino acid ABC transporter permease [Lactococcus plantarum]MDN6085034.1 amino acid ABC transporter permease [Lactococcus plantarum]PCS07966.1 amino acid ABC transporter permease [Lactococcus plantarum]HCN74579.1 amino acid ABC transporter permease [Lactococcus sp.]